MAQLPHRYEDNTFYDKEIIDVPLTEQQANMLREKLDNDFNAGTYAGFRNASVEIRDNGDGTFRVAVDPDTFNKYEATIRYEYEKANLIEKKEVKEITLPERKPMAYDVEQNEVDSHNQQFQVAQEQHRVAMTRRVTLQERLDPGESEQYQAILKVQKEQPNIDVAVFNPSDKVKAVLEAGKEEAKLREKFEILRGNAETLATSVVADRQDELGNKQPLAQPVLDRQETAEEIVGTNGAEKIARQNEIPKNKEVLERLEREQPKPISKAEVKAVAEAGERVKQALQENPTRENIEAYAALAARATDMAQQLQTSITQLIERNNEQDIPLKPAMFDRAEQKIETVEPVSPKTITPIRQEVQQKVEAEVEASQRREAEKAPDLEKQRAAAELEKQRAAERAAEIEKQRAAERAALAEKAALAERDKAVDKGAALIKAADQGIVLSNGHITTAVNGVKVTSDKFKQQVESGQGYGYNKEHLDQLHDVEIAAKFSDTAKNGYQWGDRNNSGNRAALIAEVEKAAGGLGNGKLDSKEELEAIDKMVAQSGMRGVDSDALKKTLITGNINTPDSQYQQRLSEIKTKSSSPAVTGSTEGQSAAIVVARETGEVKAPVNPTTYAVTRADANKVQAPTAGKGAGPQQQNAIT